MSIKNPQRLQIAVTPPGRDSESFRAWVESQAREQGYTDLQWEETVDQYQQAMGRLTGVRAK